MTLDVYVCEGDHEWLVKDGEEPNCCPFCQTPEFEHSHEKKFNE